MILIGSQVLAEVNIKPRDMECIWGTAGEREALTFDNPALRWNVKCTCVRKQRKRWASELYNEDENMPSVSN